MNIVYNSGLDGFLMNRKGFTCIESLLFFVVVLIIVNYVLVLSNSLLHLQSIEYNLDQQYEKAYE